MYYIPISPIVLNHLFRGLGGPKAEILITYLPDEIMNTSYTCYCDQRIEKKEHHLWRSRL